MKDSKLNELDNFLKDGDVDISKYPMSNIYKSPEARIAQKVWDYRNEQIEDLKHQKSIQELAINQIAQANSYWREKYKDLNDRANQLALDEMSTAKLNSELQNKINKAPDLIESIIARSLNKPEIQELCGQLLEALGEQQ